MSNDVMRFELCAAFFHYLWAMPLHFIVAFFIMYDSVGIASVTGMAIMGIQAIPLQGEVQFQGATIILFMAVVVRQGRHVRYCHTYYIENYLNSITFF